MSGRPTVLTGGSGSPGLSGRRESVFGGSGGAGFFPLLADPASQANDQERAYFAREEEKIHNTVAQMQKCQVLTDQMLSILDSFDDKLSALESSMLPIHKGTQALTTAQKNIDATLSETDKIILHYRIATESEESINSHRINSIDYVSYLQWVEKIHASIHFFAQNRDVSNAHADVPSSTSSGALTGNYSSDFEKYLKKLQALNKRVMIECENEFERVLSASSKLPLDLARTGWPLPSSEFGGGSFQLVPALSVKELGLIATRMALAGNQNYFGVLLAQRSGFIRASLKKIFHEEVRFFVNANSAATTALTTTTGTTPLPSPQMMHMRGSIIHQSNPSGVTIMSFGSNGSLEPLSSPSWALGSGAAASTGGGSNSQLYQKNSHRSVFYLDFFLKLIELENTFLRECLAHIFNQDELRAKELSASVTARDDSLSGGHHKALSGGGAMSLAGLSTSAATGSLTVFWGAEAYDQMFANIVDAPLDYFKKKIEQNTYLKEASLKFSSVFHLGGKDQPQSSTNAPTPSGGGGGGAVGTAAPATQLSLGNTLGNKILILLDVLEHLNALLPRYRIILKRHTQFEKLTDFQHQITSLARKSIQEYREYVCDYNEKSAGARPKGVQKDGTIYTLTVETLNFIKRLYEYRRVIEHTTTLVDKHHAGQQAEREKERGLDGGDDGGRGHISSAEEASSPLTRLVSFLLSGLEANMEHKSRSYKLASLSAIFLLNNFHYACRFFKKHETLFFAPGAGNLLPTLERYEKLVHATMKQYRTVSWEKIVSAALEPSEAGDLYRSYMDAAPGSSTHKAARSAIKAKFAAFNQSFEALYHSQRYFAIPDSDLRSQLRNDNVELIMHGYKALYDTFTQCNFSDHPAKYIRYQPHTVEMMINQFFDEESGR